MLNKLVMRAVLTACAERPRRLANVTRMVRLTMDLERTSFEAELRHLYGQGYMLLDEEGRTCTTAAGQGWLRRASHVKAPARTPPRTIVNASMAEPLVIRPWGGCVRPGADDFLAIRSRGYKC